VVVGDVLGGSVGGGVVVDGGVVVGDVVLGGVVLGGVVLGGVVLGEVELGGVVLGDGELGDVVEPLVPVAPGVAEDPVAPDVPTTGLASRNDGDAVAPPAAEADCSPACTQPVTVTICALPAWAAPADAAPD
jgi:hypothetical protein